jgi:hypothetical protein
MGEDWPTPLLKMLLLLLVLLLSGWCPGLTHTALWEVVEAHKALAAQERRLELLMQQLADKEELLEQARQLVSLYRVVIVWHTTVLLCCSVLLIVLLIVSASPGVLSPV